MTCFVKKEITQLARDGRDFLATVNFSFIRRFLNLMCKTMAMDITHVRGELQCIRKVLDSIMGMSQRFTWTFSYTRQFNRNHEYTVSARVSSSFGHFSLFSRENIKYSESNRAIQKQHQWRALTDWSIWYENKLRLNCSARPVLDSSNEYFERNFRSLCFPVQSQ